MRLLWIATKPPWPAVDGGRLVASLTLEALVGLGVEVTLVAPVGRATEATELDAELGRIVRPVLVPSAPRSAPTAALRSLVGTSPYAIVRHQHTRLTRTVEELLASERFDLVHAEQVHALAQAEPARRRRLPVVLRTHNVESDLWRSTAWLRRWAGPWLRREARRMERFEGRAIAGVARAVALTGRDAARLEELAHAEAGAGWSGAVEAVPAPFPAELPRAAGALAGAPPVVLLGGGWLPNRDSAGWFRRELWPEVRRRCPEAVLHLFGGDSMAEGRAEPTTVGHPAPADSRQVFAPGAVLVVPLRIASGVRMKILESWARGLPVVATPEAAAGLGAEDDRELLLARDGPGFAAAISRLTREPETAERLVRAGRDRLASRHAPELVARRLVEIYREALLTGAGAGPDARSRPARP